MNVLIISVSEKGGAGYSSKNLYNGLKEVGVDVSYLSFETLHAKKTGVFFRIYRWWHVRKNVNRNYDYVKDAPPGFDYFTFARTGYKSIRNHPLVKKADILSLHWISNLIDYESFFRTVKKPIVWTLHDVNPFTGGCHYTFGCDHFLAECADCPQLSERVRHFEAKANLKLKQDSLKKIGDNKNYVVAPSRWLMSLSEQSTLFKTYRHWHVPNGIDTGIFRNYEQSESRQQFNLPSEKFVVLFVGTSLNEYRKGFDIILKVRELLKDKAGILFVAAGKSSDLYEDVTSLGYIADKEEIARAYSAADVFLIPSREDNLPNTMLESLCCGTPVIGFKTGGIIDAVTHGTNGFLVEKEDVNSIAKHILDMINKKNYFNRTDISNAARAKYAIKKQAAFYKEIMEDLMKNQS